MATLADQLAREKSVTLNTPSGPLRIATDLLTPEMQQRVMAGDLASAAAVANEEPIMIPQADQPVPMQDLGLPAVEAPAPAPMRSGRLLDPAVANQMQVVEPAPVVNEVAPMMAPQAPMQPMLSPTQQEQYVARAVDTAAKVAGAEVGAIQAQIQGNQLIQQEMQKQAEADAARQKEFEVVQLENQKKLQALVSEREKMQVTGWSNKGTGVKIAAALAMALGAVGEALGGGPNRAIDIINGAIEDDIDTQMKNIAAADRGIANQQDYISRVGQLYGDDESRRNALRVLGYQKLQKDIDNMALKSKIPEVQAKALAAKEQAQMQGEKAYNDLIKSQLENLKLAKEVKQSGGESEKLWTPYGYAYEGSDVKGIREIAANQSKAMKSIQRLEEIMSMPGASLNPDIRAEADSVQTMLATSLRLPIVGPGAMTEKELEILRSLVPNTSEIFTLDSRSRARLGALRSRLESERQGVIDSNIKIPFTQQPQTQQRVQFRNENEAREFLKYQQMRGTGGPR
jgi:hypothetical protein